MINTQGHTSSNSTENSTWINECLNKKLAQEIPSGAIVVNTTPFTGRSTAERFIVDAPETSASIDWGKTNQKISQEQATFLFGKAKAELDQLPTYQVRSHAGPYPVEVTTSSPWHAMFAENMFRESSITSVSDSIRNNQLIKVSHLPNLNPQEWLPEWKFDCAILLNFAKREIVILGTSYAGEIKKSVFTICNFLLPEEGILPMHASANCLKDGSHSSVLFGLSGTGKTTLSADPNRALIGDDEIIWTEKGLSNLEGGCYAKLINLSEEDEPQIFHAVHKKGSILENVSYDPKTHDIDFTCSQITENTRGSYPLENIDNVFDQTREADIPKSIVFLTADAFGALPCVAKLDDWQAQYHFMSGYTAKVAGTEKGVTEPQATFSACFGAPFMPRPAAVYAKMLVEKARKYNCQIWLLNTGWMPGGYGQAERYPIPVSRALLTKIQSGELDKVEMQAHPFFGFQVPKTIEGIDADFLKIPDGDKVFDLCRKFQKNFEKFNDEESRMIAEKGGPRILQ